MTTFINRPRNASSFTERGRNATSVGMRPKSKRMFGDLRIEEIADYTFESVILADGTVIKDVTFETLINTIWAYRPKH